MPATAIKDLPTGLGNYGTISYGNYTFSPLRQVEVSCEPVYDEADRVVTNLKYTLQARRCVVYGPLAIAFGNPQNVCNINMGAMQDELTRAGLTLIIRDIGFDDAINTALGNPADIIWGPKPRLLNMRPVGGDFAWEFDWDCEFNVSRCASPGTLQNNPLMAFNYDWTAVVNEQGLMTRTISGYLQVPAIRGQPAGTPAETQILFNVDAQWDKITFGVPYGFRRTQNVHTINKAKNRIDFAITDTELTGTAFPAGIVEGDLEYSIGSQKGGLAEWMGSLSGSLTVAPGYPASLAAQKFFLIADDKVQKLRACVSQSIPDAQVIPLLFEMRHGIFTRTSHFSLTWMTICDLGTLLKASGMWAEVPGTDYPTWKTSMDAANVMGNRGVSGLAWSNSDDRLIGVCMAVGSPNIVEVADNADNETDTEAQNLQDDSESKPYLLYRNVVRPAAEQNIVLHRYAQQYQPGQSTYTDHVLQYPAAPDNLVLMEGAAVRVNALPDLPEITTIGGQPVEKLWLHPVVDQVPVSLSFGNAIYRARWQALYRVKGEPTLAAVGAVPEPVVNVQQPLLGVLVSPSGPPTV